MIADGIRQEIRKVLHADADLRAAEHFVKRRFQNPRLRDKMPGEVARTLEKRAVALRDRPLDGNAYPGLKMRIQGETLRHGDRQRAMRKGCPPLFRVEDAGIAHENVLSRHVSEDRHRKERGHVALAAAVNAETVQDCKSETAG